MIPSLVKKIHEAEDFRLPYRDFPVLLRFPAVRARKSRDFFPLEMLLPLSASPPLALLTQQTQIILVSPEFLARVSCSRGYQRFPLSHGNSPGSIALCAPLQNGRDTQKIVCHSEDNRC